MARPRKATLDAWLETFSRWSAEDRAGALEQAADAHRWMSVAEQRLAEKNGKQEEEKP